MTALLLGNQLTAGTYLERADLKAGLPEHWLRDRIFENPRLLPLDRIEPGSGDVIPICREFPLSKYGSQVFLDMLGMTRSGRLVLVECKLWRNPQARREVVAQLLEYASLMRRLSFADLTATLKSRRGMIGENPLHALLGPSPSIGEAEFSDAVSRCLRTGDFDLIVAGDGIREDMAVITEHLRDGGTRLALVEIQLWGDGAGHSLLVPHIPFRTEVVRQRLLVDRAGDPIAMAVDAARDEVEAALPFEEIDQRRQTRDDNRAFMDRVITEMRFDHPDQPPARHGGNNWLKVPLPLPARWFVCWRTESGMGVTIRMEDQVALEALFQDADAIREDAGLPYIRFDHLPDGTPRWLHVEVARPAGMSETDQIVWFADHANRMVNAVRPRLTRLTESGW